MEGKILAVLLLVGMASGIGLVVRRFGLRTWHLGVVYAVGFLCIGLSDSRVDNALTYVGFALFLFGGGGLFYVWFLGGDRRQPDPKPRRGVASGPKAGGASGDLEHIRREVKRLTAKSDTNALSKRLRHHRDPRMRALAAEALRTVPGLQNTGPLVQALLDEDAEVRQQAVRTLEAAQWTPGDERERASWLLARRRWDDLFRADRAATARALVELLQNAGADTSLLLLSLLWEVGAPAIPVLIERLKDSGAELRTLLAMAVCGFQDAKQGTFAAAMVGQLPARGQVRADVFGALPLIGEPAVPLLAAALRAPESDQSARVEAATGLSHLGSLAMPSLKEALGDSRADVRLFAAFALIGTGSPDAIDAVRVAREREPDEQSRSDMSLVLSKLGVPSQALLVARLLKDREVLHRKLAAVALGHIGDGEAVAALCKAAASDPHEGVVSASMLSLARLTRYPEARAFFIGGLEERDPAMRLSAALILAAAGVSVLRELDRINAQRPGASDAQDTEPAVASAATSHTASV